MNCEGFPLSRFKLQRPGEYGTISFNLHSLTHQYAATGSEDRVQYEYECLEDLYLLIPEARRKFKTRFSALWMSFGLFL